VARWKPHMADAYLVARVKRQPTSTERESCRRQLIPSKSRVREMRIGDARLGVQRDAAASEVCCRSLLQVGVRYQGRAIGANLLGHGLSLERHPIKQDPTVDATLKG
jgi:hypothetical protein